MSFALNVIAKATFILICTSVFSMLLRRSSASTRHAVWILALISALLLPFLALVVPQFEWSMLPRASTSVTFVSLENVPTSITVVERGLKPATTYERETFRLQPGYVWLLGAVVLLIRFVMGTVAVRRMAKEA